MEEILDHETEPIKDERLVNRITAFARYTYIAHTFYVLVSILVGDIEGAISGVLAYKARFVVGVFITLFFFYYNIRHANAEWNSKYVYPLFRQPFVVIFLLYACYLLFTFAGSIIDNLLMIPSFPEYFYVLLELIVGRTIAVLTLAWIVYREFVYLKRISKSQNIISQ